MTPDAEPLPHTLLIDGSNSDDCCVRSSDMDRKATVNQAQAKALAGLNNETYRSEFGDDSRQLDVGNY